jgi:hypothetical protein
MLTDSIRRHEFDIIFIQEVVSPEIMNIKGYVTHLSIRTAMRGTAILARNDFPLKNIVTIPSRRAITADFIVIRLVAGYVRMFQHTKYTAHYTRKSQCVSTVYTHYRSGPLLLTSSRIARSLNTVSHNTPSLTLLAVTSVPQLSLAAIYDCIFIRVRQCPG